MQNPDNFPSDPLSKQTGEWPPLGPVATVPFSQGWQWLVDGFQLFKANPSQWIAMTALYLVLMVALSVIPVLSLVSPILAPVFTGGLMLACRRQDMTGQLDFRDLFAGFQQKAGPLSLLGLIFLGLYLALGLVLALLGGGAFMQMGDMHPGQNPVLALQGVGFVVVLGLLLLVPILMAQWFAPALVALHDVAPWEACKLSLSACFRNSMPFLIYGGVLFLAAIIASVPAMLGWLVLLPVMFASVYVGYKDIFQVTRHG